MKIVMKRKASETSGRPIRAMATAATRKHGSRMRRKLERSISWPITRVPMVPPTCRAVPASTALAVDRPASLAMVGSQFERKYKFSRFMKLMTHKSIVIFARPPVNNCSTGAPLCSFSCTTYCVSAVIVTVGSMRFSHLATLSSLRFFSTRNCIDSGSRKNISTPITSGTTPPT